MKNSLTKVEERIERPKTQGGCAVNGFGRK